MADVFLVSNTGVVVGNSGRVSITSQMLEYSDSDVEAHQLVYTLESAPTRGTLTVNGHVLAVGSTFTQGDVNSGLVSYLYTDDEAATDSFSFSVDEMGGSDSGLSGQVFSFDASAIDPTPTVRLNADAGTTITDQGDEPLGELTGQFSASRSGGDYVNFSVEGAVGDFTYAEYTRSVETTYGTLFYHPSTGDWRFVANEDAVAPLTEGDSVEASFTIIANSLSYPANLYSETLTVEIFGGNDAPHLTTNERIQVSQQDDVTITPEFLQAEDIDNANAEDIVFTITDAPQDGRVLVDGVEASSFTAADLAAGVVRYENTGSATSDSFSFQLSNGDEGGSVSAIQTFHIDVTTPSLSINFHAGSEVTDTAAYDDFGDVTGYFGFILDPGMTVSGLVIEGGEALAQDIVFSGGFRFNHQVVSDYGILYYNESGSGGFRFVVDNDAVQVMRAGDEAVLSFDVTVTADGASDTETLSITITGAEDTTEVVVNTNPSVEEAGRLTLTDAMLSARDGDASADEIIYTITSPTARGSLILDGVVLMSGATFTQADINAGRVSYLHGGDNIPADSFIFDVHEGDDPASATRDQLFLLNVNLVNDAPTITIKSDAPTTLVDTEADDTFADIDGSFTLADDEGTALTFTIEGAEAHTGDADFSLRKIGDYGVLYFNPEGGNWRYVPNNAAIQALGDATESDTFTLSLEDGDGNVTTEELVITIEGNNDLPTLAVNSGMIVEEGGSQQIISAMLRAEDNDHSASEIDFIIRQLPNHGTLTLNGVEVTANQIIRKSDLDSGALTYTHSGDEATSDSIGISATDYVGTMQSSFAISILPSNDAPQITHNEGLAIYENSEVVISSAELMISDADNSASEITYTITTLPAYGALLLDGGEVATGDSFTQADIDAGLLRYQHDGSEGDAIDIFLFTAMSGSGDEAHAIAEQHFVISVSTMNDAPEASPLDNQETFFTSFSFTIPAETFSDEEDSSLTISASLADGSALPEWLSFDAASGEFSGAAPFIADAYSFDIRVTATDSDGGTGFSDFTLDIIDPLYILGENGERIYSDGAPLVSEEVEAESAIDLGALGATVDVSSRLLFLLSDSPVNANFLIDEVEGVSHLYYTGGYTGDYDEGAGLSAEIEVSVLLAESFGGYSYIDASGSTSDDDARIFHYRGGDISWDDATSEIVVTDGVIVFEDGTSASFTGNDLHLTERDWVVVLREAFGSWRTFLMTENDVPNFEELQGTDEAYYVLGRLSRDGELIQYTSERTDLDASGDNTDSHTGYFSYTGGEVSSSFVGSPVEGQPGTFTGSDTASVASGQIVTLNEDFDEVRYDFSGLSDVEYLGEQVVVVYNDGSDWVSGLFSTYDTFVDFEAAHDEYYVLGTLTGGDQSISLSTVARAGTLSSLQFVANQAGDAGKAIRVGTFYSPTYDENSVVAHITESASEILIELDVGHGLSGQALLDAINNSGAGEYITARFPTSPNFESGPYVVLDSLVPVEIDHNIHEFQANTEIGLSPLIHELDFDGEYVINLENIDDNTPVFDSPIAGDEALEEHDTLGFRVAIDAEVAIGDTLVTASASDADGDTVTYSLEAQDSEGNDASSLFAIDETSGVVTLSQALNLENSYTLTITASSTSSLAQSQGEQSATQTITLILAEGNQAPEANLGSALLSVDEGGSFTLSRDELYTFDIDDPSDTVTYTITDSPQHGRLMLGASEVISFTQADIDSGQIVYIHDDSETITDHFTFTIGDAAEQDFAITINAINDAPQIAYIPDALFPFGEESSFALPRIVATDREGDSLSLSVSLADGGALPEWLTYDADSLTFVGTPPEGVEHSYTIRLTVTDAQGAISQKDFTLSVIPRVYVEQSDGTQIYSPDSVLAAEEAAGDLNLGTLRLDEGLDVGERFILTDSPINADFDIEENEGEYHLIYTGSDTGDFESGDSHSISLESHALLAANFDGERYADASGDRSDADTREFHYDGVQISTFYDTDRSTHQVVAQPGAIYLDDGTTYSFNGKGFLTSSTDLTLVVFEFSSGWALEALNDQGFADLQASGEEYYLIGRFTQTGETLTASDGSSYNDFALSMNEGSADASGDATDTDFRNFNYEGGVISTSFVVSGDEIIYEASVSDGTFTVSGAPAQAFVGFSNRAFDGEQIVAITQADGIWQAQLFDDESFAALQASGEEYFVLGDIVNEGIEAEVPGVHASATIGDVIFKASEAGVLDTPIRLHYTVLHPQSQDGLDDVVVSTRITHAGEYEIVLYVEEDADSGAALVGVARHSGELLASSIISAELVEGGDYESSIYFEDPASPYEVYLTGGAEGTPEHIIYSGIQNPQSDYSGDLGYYLASEDFTISLRNGDDNAPIFDAPQSDLRSNPAEGVELGFTLEIATAIGTSLLTASASDADGDTVTYSLEAQDSEGNDATALFSIDSASGEVTLAASLPSASDEYSLTITASSTSSLEGSQGEQTATQSISILTREINLAPLATTGTIGFVVEEGGSHVLTQADLHTRDLDDAPSGIIYTLNHGPSHGRFMKDGEEVRSFSQADIDEGRVTYEHSGVEIFGDNFSFRVDDGNEDNSAPALQNALIIVASSNDAPEVANTISDQQAISSQAFRYTLADNIFSDEENDPFTISVTLAGRDFLPSWLSFDASTMTLSGTPSFGSEGEYTISVVAEDAEGQTAQTDFTLDVIAGVSVDSSDNVMRQLPEEFNPQNEDDQEAFIARGGEMIQYIHAGETFAAVSLGAVMLPEGVSGTPTFTLTDNAMNEDFFISYQTGEAVLFYIGDDTGDYEAGDTLQAEIAVRVTLADGFFGNAYHDASGDFSDNDLRFFQQSGGVISTPYFDSSDSISGAHKVDVSGGSITTPDGMIRSFEGLDGIAFSGEQTVAVREVSGALEAGLFDADAFEGLKDSGAEYFVLGTIRDSGGVAIATETIADSGTLGYIHFESLAGRDTPPYIVSLGNHFDTLEAGQIVTAVVPDTGLGSEVERIYLNLNFGPYVTWEEIVEAWSSSVLADYATATLTDEVRADDVVTPEFASGYGVTLSGGSWALPAHTIYEATANSETRSGAIDQDLGTHITNIALENVDDNAPAFDLPDEGAGSLIGNQDGEIRLALEGTVPSGEAIFTVDGYDPDGDTVRFSLSATNQAGNPISEIFAVDSASGAVTMNDGFTLQEGETYTITVTGFSVSDLFGGGVVRQGEQVIELQYGTQPTTETTITLTETSGNVYLTKSDDSRIYSDGTAQLDEELTPTSDVLLGSLGISEHAGAVTFSLTSDATNQDFRLENNDLYYTGSYSGDAEAGEQLRSTVSARIEAEDNFYGEAYVDASGDFNDLDVRRFQYEGGVIEAPQFETLSITEGQHVISVSGGSITLADGTSHAFSGLDRAVFDGEAIVAVHEHEGSWQVGLFSAIESDSYVLGTITDTGTTSAALPRAATGTLGSLSFVSIMFGESAAPINISLTDALTLSDPQANTEVSVWESLDDSSVNIIIAVNSDAVWGEVITALSNSDASDYIIASLTGGTNSADTVTIPSEPHILLGGGSDGAPSHSVYVAEQNSQTQSGSFTYEVTEEEYLINLININDNAPEVLTPQDSEGVALEGSPDDDYWLTLDEANVATSGSQIFSVSSRDADGGSVSYTLTATDTHGNDASNLFAISSQEDSGFSVGMITSQAGLSFADSDRYTITIEGAISGGIPGSDEVQRFTQVITITDRESNSAPVLEAADRFTINQGETITLDGVHLAVSDADDALHNLIYRVEEIGAGTLTHADGSALETDHRGHMIFTAADIAASDIRYTASDENGFLSVTVRDGLGGISEEMTFALPVRTEYMLVSTEPGASFIMEPQFADDAVLIRTGYGSNTIITGTGDDQIYAGLDDDIIDLSEGGADEVSYSFARSSSGEIIPWDGGDTISGFSLGEDMLVLGDNAEDVGNMAALDAFLEGLGSGFEVSLLWQSSVRTSGTGFENYDIRGIEFVFADAVVLPGGRVSGSVLSIHFEEAVSWAEMDSNYDISSADVFSQATRLFAATDDAREQLGHILSGSISDSLTMPDESTSRGVLVGSDEADTLEMADFGEWVILAGAGDDIVGLGRGSEEVIYRMTDNGGLPTGLDGSDLITSFDLANDKLRLVDSDGEESDVSELLTREGFATLEGVEGAYSGVTFSFDGGASLSVGFNQLVEESGVDIEEIFGDSLIISDTLATELL